MFRSATAKLTLWYVLLASCLCILFIAVVYHLSTEELGEALNHQYNSFVDNDHDKDNIPPPHSDIQRHGRHLLGELLWLNLAEQHDTNNVFLHASNYTAQVCIFAYWA